MVMTVYEYPAFATIGWCSVLFLLLSGMCWFIPTAICAAEMATIKKWESGGIYTWVTNMLGPRWGFAAVFYQWFQITIGFVTMLYFISSALCYGVGGEVGFNLVSQTPFSGTGENLAYSPWILFGIVVGLLLLLTLSQMFGIKYTAIIANVGFAVGIIIPSLIMFGFGIENLVVNGLSNIGTGLFPDESTVPVISQLVIFVSFILGYMGVEASASQARNMDNPTKKYPTAIFALVVVKIVFSGLGGIMIAIAIPPGSVSLSGGVIQALLVMTHQNEILVRILAILLVLGVAAEVTSWIVGPSSGLLFAAKSGAIPSAFAKVNKYNIPYFIILVQTISVIMWAALLTFAFGGAGSSFLSAITLTVLVYLLGYFLMYIAYLKFVFKHNDLERDFKIKHKWLQVSFGVLAIITSMFAFVVSFFPQGTMTFGDSQYNLFVAILVPCLVVSAALPFIFFEIYQRVKKKASTPDIKDKNKLTNKEANYAKK